MTTHYVVHYHRDGGQACIAARRVFTVQEHAMNFFKRYAHEVGHTCNTHTWLELSEVNPGDADESYLERQGRL